MGALGLRFESCRPDQTKKYFPAFLFFMGKSTALKTLANELSIFIEKLVQIYNSPLIGIILFNGGK